jgi:LysR family transcriptional activator of glutamate synthase operon
MDLRQLRSLVTIAEEGQFTRAAERLGIAQSSLSSQIRLLEQELGLALFNRTTRRVSLTDAGASLIITARSVLAEIDEARADLLERRRILVGRVTIGVTQTPGPVNLIELLAGFHHQHPTIELAIREDLSVNLADQLRTDDLDGGILTVTEPEDCRGLAVQLLAVEPLVAVMRPTHALAARSHLTMNDLRDESFVVSPAGATIRTALMRTAHASGFDPKISFESREVTRIRAIVSAGLGVALLPGSDARSPGPPVAAVELLGGDLNHTLSLCWRDRRRQSPAAEAFLTHARTILTAP